MSSIKILPHGTGSGRQAVKYLLQALDSRGQPRGSIKVLEGDPAMTARLIDSLDTVQRYTSLVIAWHAEDRPTEVQMRMCLDELIELMRAGLDADRLDVLAVMHDGHLHVIVPRVDLLTGKAYNPAPPGWERAYGALRDSWNYEHNWARPDDPARARPLQPGRVPPVERDPRILMTRAVEDALLAGTITDRAGVVRVLEAHGQITREGRDSVSVTLPTSSRPVRLKGQIFARELDADAVRAAVARDRSADTPQPSGCGVDAATARSRAHIARQSLAEAMKRREAYTATRYRKRPAPDAVPAWAVEDPDLFMSRQRAIVNAMMAARKPVRRPAASVPAPAGHAPLRRPSEPRPQAGAWHPRGAAQPADPRVRPLQAAEGVRVVQAVQHIELESSPGPTLDPALWVAVEEAWARVDAGQRASSMLQRWPKREQLAAWRERLPPSQRPSIEAMLLRVLKERGLPDPSALPLLIDAQKGLERAQLDHQVALAAYVKAGGVVPVEADDSDTQGTVDRDT